MGQQTRVSRSGEERALSEGRAAVAVRGADRLRQIEWIGLAAAVVLYALLRVVGLRAAVINDKLDEGVYFSLMQATAAGKGALYRDYILCHPPGVVWVGAWLWGRVHGSLFALRLIYIAVAGLGFVPMYALARRLYGVQAALITLANWLGRNIYLDLLLNVPLYVALWALACHARGRPLVAAGAGTLLGLSFLIKETALPAGVLACLALFAAARFPPAVRSTEDPARQEAEDGGIDRWTWLWFGAAFLVVSGMVLACLSRIPNYIYYTFTLNANDTYQWRLRPYELLNGFYALPLPLTFGVVGIWWMTRHSCTPAERFLGLFTLAMTLLMLLLPKRFYWRYLAHVLPLYCLGVAVWWQRFTASHPSCRARTAVTAFGTLLILVHVAGLWLYRRFEEPNPPEYAAALQMLRRSPDPLFTLNPIWAAASGHPLSPAVQNLIRAAIFVPVTPQEYNAVLAQCPTVLLDKETGHWLPKESEQALRQQYHVVFEAGKPGDRHWIAILRRDAAPHVALSRNHPLILLSQN